MNKRNHYFKILYGILVYIFILASCSNNHGVEEKIFLEYKKEELEEKMEVPEMKSSSVSIELDTEDFTKNIGMEPEIVDTDWSEYFNGLNGTAVIYNATNKQYTIYKSDLALIRRSPCSTFKMISSLIALENGILKPEDSTRIWSREVFWNEDWNKDMDFSEAFHTSCVWYYRQVIDDIGKDMMQKELDKLQYGNCDISDWEGQLNTNNNNRALTGFWIESSLMISPKEQVEVMARIFGENSDYSEETRNELKQVMLLSEQERADRSIYGKTGMGKEDGMNVSSLLAKEIAIQIVSDWNGL